MTGETDSIPRDVVDDASLSKPPERGADLADREGEMETSSRTSRSHRTAPFFAVVFVFVSGLLWSALTPPGGVPDEPAHLVYAAAVVRNDFGAPVPVDGPNFSVLMSHTVPAWISSIAVCYAFDPAVTADCQLPIVENSDPVPSQTTVSRYPPVYYWIVGLPSRGLSGARAFYAMRLMSVALSTVLIGLGLVTAAPGRRWWLSIGVVASFTPMVAFLVGSVNPNGAEISASIGLAVAMLGLTGDPSGARRIWVQVASIAVLGGYLAWARPSTWLVLGAVVGATLLLNRRSAVAWVRRNPLAGVTVGLAVGVAVAGTEIYEVLVRNPIKEAMSSGQVASPAPFLENLDSTLGHWAGWLMNMVGIFGWLDHAAPPLLATITLMILGTLVVLALAVGRGTDRLLVIVIVAGSTFLAPLFVLQTLFGSVTGYQARYHLSLAVLVVLSSVFVLGLRWKNEFQPLLRPILAWIGFGAPLVMAASAMWSLSRYSIGAPLVWSNLFLLRFLRDAVWLPPAKAMAVAVLGLIGLIGLIPALWHLGAGVTTISFEREREGEGHA